MIQEKQNYIDRTILRLRRQYDKDELVSALNKQIKEKDMEIGMLKSEIDELKHELNVDHNEAYKIAQIEIKKNNIFNAQKEQNKKLKAEVKRLRKTNKELIVKVIKLNKELC